MSMLPGPQRALHVKPRWDSDFYVEPASCVHSLFNSIGFTGTIHDPACGGGTIPKTAQTHGYTITASDLVDRGYGTGGINFMDDATLRDNIVCNPPYKFAEDFIIHALKIARHRIAMIVRLPFLCSQGRRDRLFNVYPPLHIIFLGQRPSMPPGGSGIPATGGTTDYCWIVWDRQEPDARTECLWV